MKSRFLVSPYYIVIYLRPIPLRIDHLFNLMNVLKQTAKKPKIFSFTC